MAHDRVSHTCRLRWKAFTPSYEWRPRLRRGSTHSQSESFKHGPYSIVELCTGVFFYHDGAKRLTSDLTGSTTRTHQDNGYGGRGQPSRNDSYGNGAVSKPDGYYDNNYNNNGYQPNRARYPRNGPESTLNNGAGVYSPNGNQQSYETVTTASGSGSSGEPLGYTTDPSSDNSSIDRIPHSNQSNGQYNGGNSYGGYPSPSNQQYVAGGAPQGYQTNGHQSQNGPPPPPKMEGGPPRPPIKLGTSADGPTNYEAARPVPEKRKSWFGKRFGKS